MRYVRKQKNEGTCEKGGECKYLQIAFQDPGIWHIAGLFGYKFPDLRCVPNTIKVTIIEDRFQEIPRY